LKLRSTSGAGLAFQQAGHGAQRRWQVVGIAVEDATASERRGVRGLVGSALYFALACRVVLIGGGGDGREDTEDRCDHRDADTPLRPLPLDAVEVLKAVPLLVFPGHFAALESQPERHDPAHVGHQRQQADPGAVADRPDPVQEKCAPAPALHTVGNATIIDAVQRWFVESDGG
jgi:hypothetical protein